MMRYLQPRAALSAHILPATFGALLIAVGLGASANAQSFDCRNARSADERAICQDSRLGDLDKQLADVYDRVGGKLSNEDRAAFEKNETAFVNARHRCGGHQGCIEQSYRNRLQELLSALPGEATDRSERRSDTKRADRQKNSRDGAKTEEVQSGTDETKRDAAETSAAPPERGPRQEEAKSTAASPPSSPETRSRRNESGGAVSAVPNPPSRHEAEAALAGPPPPEKQSRHKQRKENAVLPPAAPDREEPPAASAPSVLERRQSKSSTRAASEPHPAAPASAAVPEKHPASEPHPPPTASAAVPGKHPASGSSTATAAEPASPPEKRHPRAKHVATGPSGPPPAPADQAQPASKPEIKWVNPAPSP